VRKWQQVRGGESIFHAALDGITGFELTHWTREQLAAAYHVSSRARGGPVHQGVGV